MATYPGIYSPMIINDRTDVSSWSGLTPDVSTPVFIQASQTVGAEKEDFYNIGARNPQNKASVVRNRPASGLFAFQYEFLYDALYCDPSYVNVGILTEQTTFQFLVGNLYFQPAHIVVNRYDYEGIQDDAGGEFTLGPLEDKLVNVTITLNGGMTFEASSLFTADNIPLVQSASEYSLMALDAEESQISTYSSSRFASASSTYVGERSIVWPFMFNEGFTETWEWNTHIIKTWDFNEERIALRKNPRISIDATYSTTEEDTSFCDDLIIGQGHLAFGIPMFQQGTFITAPPAGSTEITFSQSGMIFSANGKGILWKDNLHFESFSIESVGAGIIYLKKPLLKSLEGTCTLAPLVSARIQNNITKLEYGESAADIKMSWLVDSDFPYQMNSGIGPIFNNYPLLEVPIYVQNKQLQRTMNCPKIILDNGLGQIKYAHVQTYENMSYPVYIPCANIETIEWLRSIIAGMQGNVRPFWMLSGRKDFIVIEPIEPGGRIAVKNSNYSLYGKTKRKYIWIQLTDGTTYLKTITGSAMDSSGEKEYLTLDTAIKNTTIQPNEVYMISFLFLVRMSSDKVQWEWKLASNRSNVTFSVTEVLG